MSTQSVFISRFRSPSGLSHPPVLAQQVSPLPNPQSNLTSNVPSPGILDPASENQFGNLPSLELPVEEEILDSSTGFLLPAPKRPDKTLEATDDTYTQTAQEQMTRRNDDENVAKIFSNKEIGFIDDYGYLVEIDEIPEADSKTILFGAPGTRGEATLFTATAVIALATGNYKPGSWESQKANVAISEFLDVLQNKGWANTDFLFEGETSGGSKHPIRHPGWYEWDRLGRMRPRPLSKDSFGQIVAACYYAYNCPNSTDDIRKQCQSLLNQWITYLSEHKWTIHTNWAKDEFESPTFGQDRVKPIGHLGIETFVLLPHELYALKNCAKSLSVPHTIIVPILDTTVAIDNAMLEIAKSFRNALDHILDLFTYSESYDIELIHGWRRSAIKGRFSVNLLVPAKTAILDAFESACKVAFSENTAMFRDPHKLSLGFDTLIAGSVDKITGLFPEVLKKFPFGTVLLDLFKQLLPWFDPEILVEFCAFYYFVPLALAANDSDIGYTVWSFVIELECRPPLTLILFPYVAVIWGKILNGGNPNGVWAWLAGDTSTVDAQINRFKAQHLNHWRAYAYTKNYNEWLKDSVTINPDTHGPAASRLDYLLLVGLRKMGRPKLAPGVELNTKQLLEGFKQCIQALIDEAIDAFKILGKFEHEFIDLSGATVKEIIHQIDGFTRTISRVGGQTSKFVHHLSGEVEQTVWEGLGSFSHSIKWAKALPDLTLDPNDVIQFQLRNALDGSMRVWTWTSGALNSFTKYSNTAIDGVITDLEDFTVKQLRELDGQLKQWIKASRILVSFTHWGSSSISGIADSQKLLLATVRDPTGPLKQWVYDADKGLKSFNHWVDSNSDFSVAPGKLATEAIRKVDGTLIIITKEGERFISQLTFARSTAEAAAAPVDCVLYTFRAIDGVVEQWDIDGGLPKKYRKWAKSTLSGNGLAKDMVKSVERSDGGKFISRTYSNGVEVGGQVLDKLGNELEKLGKGASDVVQDAGDAIGKVFHGWHL